jgi:hypothetical protein
LGRCLLWRLGLLLGRCLLWLLWLLRLLLG